MYTGNVVVCEDLLDIPSGSVALSGNSVGSTAIYRCVTGFILLGDAIRTCQPNGQWSGSEPSCGKQVLLLYIE